MTETVAVVKERSEKLERRKALEIQGYQAELQILRDKETYTNIDGFKADLVKLTEYYLGSTKSSCAESAAAVMLQCVSTAFFSGDQAAGSTGGQ